MKTLDLSWQNKLASVFEQPYMAHLRSFLVNEKKAGFTIYPPTDLTFNALNTTPFDSVKVIILGQDPYHGVGQAHGLSFSVPNGIAPPPSLCNIYKELEQDIKNFVIPKHGNLTHWAQQGVLLLNTVLTVRANQAFSHRNQGWETFTDSIIKTLNTERENLIFVLWGSPAKAKANLIDSKKHLILTSSHPSPLSSYRGFFGCKHFSKINQYLESKKLAMIDWQV
ncbi:MAG: uracil-DNA glycosylase [Gammaproteobacteria bacterium]|nr:uracil-DNA glycosylase [Gammaproteobacteria bacterium]